MGFIRGFLECPACTSDRDMSTAPLVMVLGHSACGAVKAAVKHLHDKDSLPGAINGLVELVKPAVTQSAGMSLSRLSGGQCQRPPLCEKK